MSMDWQRLGEALHCALSLPEVRDDASRCAACIEWLIQEPGQALRPLTLWAGETDGPLISIQSDEGILARAMAAEPTPGYQSFGALRRQVAGFVVHADALFLSQALAFIERLLEAWRSCYHQKTPAGIPAAAHPVDDSGLRHLRGRYLALPLAAGQAQGNPSWVFAERAGDPRGQPLLMLHTAGADARQWHGLMGSEALHADWDLHAFDLPGHGRSPLPAGIANWQWRLTESQYIDWVLGYMDAAQLDKAVLMGCSMGSAIGLALLARHPDRFAGALLLEAPYHSPGRRSPYLNHPEVHGGRIGAAWVGSLLSPTSNKSDRDRATWIYSQAAPGIYDGDLAFYSDDFNAHEHTAAINTQRTPLWLLTGDYDYSASPADSAKIAAEVPGAHFSALKGFGHFPMVENPRGLLPHLEVALKALHAASLKTRKPPSIA